MNYKIVVDSSGEFTKEEMDKLNIVKVPLHISVLGHDFTDDETMDVPKLLTLMKASKEIPKTACPSPQSYYEAIEGDEKDVYIITLSAELSGSYNSACMAKELFEEDNGTDKKIHVINSKSASVAQSLIAFTIASLYTTGQKFDDVVAKIAAFISEQRTFFVLDNLQNLSRSGRLPAMITKLLDMINIKVFCEGNSEGKINLAGFDRGLDKAVNKMVERISNEAKDITDKIMLISYCNCLQRAIELKDKILKKCNFQEIRLYEMGGLSSTYADDGGLIVTF